MVKKRTKIVSLAYSDSDSENEDSIEEGEDVEDEEMTDNQADNGPANEEANENGESAENDAEVEPFFEDVHGDRDISIVEFHQSLFGKTVDEIEIPLPTKRRCPDDLQRKIEVYYEKVKMGSDLNKSIQKRKDLRNPSIYEKMISYCQINEMATNYPKEIYDPEPFLRPESYYEEISKQQKEEMEKRAASRADAAKSGEASKRPAVPSAGEGTGKKSKWDAAPTASSASAAIAVALSKVQSTLAQANKPIVISAFGTINKRK